MIKICDLGKDTIHIEEDFLVDYIESYLKENKLFKETLIKVDMANHFTKLNDFSIVLFFKKDNRISAEIMKIINSELTFLLKSIFGIERAKIAISIE